jgi:predicted DNA-binding protein with PD1-like motif
MPLISFFPAHVVDVRMHYREVETVGEYLLRLEHGRDWRAQLEEFAAEEGVDAGWFVGLGAVQDATLWYYHQDEGEYEPVEFDEHLEVAACVGNVSELDGESFAHTHAVLSRPDGESVAGHLDEATVFAGELYVTEFDTGLVREHDATTDLDLWL